MENNKKFRFWSNAEKKIMDWEWCVKNLELGDISNPNMDQFTGFVDINGKEIYFGDIVKFSFHDREQGDYYMGTALVIETMNNGVGILYDRSDTDESICFAVREGGVIEDIWKDDDLWTFEVINNIRENPELL